MASKRGMLGALRRMFRRRDAASLVVRLLGEPGRLSELEAIIGPVRMSFRSEDQENMGWLSRPPVGERGEFTPLVTRLSVRYAWDMYHEEPTRPRDVSLLEYTLHLRGDRAAVERVLRSRFGGPRLVAEPLQLAAGVHHEEHAAYGPFYVSDSRPGELLLRWFASTPRFAIPEPDLAVREGWLGELGSRLASASTLAEVDAFCRKAPPGAGVTAESRGGSEPGAVEPADCSISFRPPVPARMLVDAFGWGAAVGVSTDVHLASWHVELAGEDRLPRSGPLRQWQLTARLAGWPSGPRLPEARRGPCIPCAIGDDDEVTSLTVEPPTH